jgi:hypothetical protein
VHSRGQKKYQRSRRLALLKVKAQLNTEKRELNEREHAFQFGRYTSSMLAMRRDAANQEQRAAIERLYLESTGKHLQDVLEQHIIASLKAKYP